MFLLSPDAFVWLSFLVLLVGLHCLSFAMDMPIDHLYCKEVAVSGSNDTQPECR